MAGEDEQWRRHWHELMQQVRAAPVSAPTQEPSDRRLDARAANSPTELAKRSWVDHGPKVHGDNATGA